MKRLFLSMVLVFLTTVSVFAGSVEEWFYGDRYVLIFPDQDFHDIKDVTFERYNEGVLQYSISLPDFDAYYNFFHEIEYGFPLIFERYGLLPPNVINPALFDLVGKSPYENSALYSDGEGGYYFSDYDHLNELFIDVSYLEFYARKSDNSLVVISGNGTGLPFTDENYFYGINSNELPNSIFNEIYSRSLGYTALTSDNAGNSYYYDTNGGIIKANGRFLTTANAQSYSQLSPEVIAHMNTLDSDGDGIADDEAYRGGLNPKTGAPLPNGLGEDGYVPQSGTQNVGTGGDPDPDPDPDPDSDPDDKMGAFKIGDIAIKAWKVITESTAPLLLYISLVSGAVYLIKVLRDMSGGGESDKCTAKHNNNNSSYSTNSTSNNYESSNSSNRNNEKQKTNK